MTDDLRYLPDDPAVVATVAAWHQEQWGRLTGRSTAQRIREFDAHRASRGVPLTVLAYAEQRPVGSASLLADDMDTHPELTPWLASVFVLPAYRRGGVGERLCRRIMAEARRLDVARLYLYTPDQAPFYAKMGWRELARERYHGESVTLMDWEPGAAAL